MIRSCLFHSGHKLECVFDVIHPQFDGKLVFITGTRFSYFSLHVSLRGRGVRFRLINTQAEIKGVQQHNKGKFITIENDEKLHDKMLDDDDMALGWHLNENKIIYSINIRASWATGDDGWSWSGTGSVR